MEENSISAIVTDDHTLFRKGMVMILKSFPEITEVRDAENGQKALDLLAEEPADILLLDLEMPVLDGWATAEKVLKKYPNTHIIMVSMHDSLKVISGLIELGVHSYLLKNAEPDEIQRAIISVMSNDFYYNQLVAKALHQKIKGDNNNPFQNDKANLTKREVEILALICQELTMKEIGEKLFISEQTIHTHRKNLMRKTEAKNAVGLVKYAIQQKVVAF